jgi:hypothetical protein
VRGALLVVGVLRGKGRSQRIVIPVILQVLVEPTPQAGCKNSLCHQQSCVSIQVIAGTNFGRLVVGCRVMIGFSQFGSRRHILHPLAARQPLNREGPVFLYAHEPVRLQAAQAVSQSNTFSTRINASSGISAAARSAASGGSNCRGNSGLGYPFGMFATRDTVPDALAEQPKFLSRDSMISIQHGRDDGLRSYPRH